MRPTEAPAQVKQTDSANTSPSFNSAKLRKRSSKSSIPHVTHSSRSSLHMFPIISGLVDKQNLEIGKFFKFRFHLIWFCFCSNKIFVFNNFNSIKLDNQQNTERCVMVHCNRVTVQIFHWIELGIWHQKTIYIHGWPNNPKAAKNLKLKTMLKP